MAPILIITSFEDANNSGREKNSDRREKYTERTFTAIIGDVMRAGLGGCRRTAPQQKSYELFRLLVAGGFESPKGESAHRVVGNGGITHFIQCHTYRSDFFHIEFCDGPPLKRHERSFSNLEG